MAEMWKFIALQIVFPLTTIVVFYLLFNSKRRAKGDDSAGILPGSTGFPIVGESLSFFEDFNKPTGVQGFTGSRAKRYGKTFLTNILGRNWVFTFDREVIKFIYSSDRLLFSTGSSRSAQDMFGDHSVSFAGGDVHRRIRRLVVEPLLGDNLKKLFGRIEALCLDVLDGWSGKTLCALDGASMFTFQVIIYMIASMEKGPELTELLQSFLAILDAITSFPFKIPGTSYYRGCKERKKLMAVLDTIIDRRRKGEEVKDDFIQSMILKDSLPQEERLSDVEIKDNCLGLLLGGFASTATSITWAMKFLEENQDAKETLMEEFKRIQDMKAGSNVANLTWDDIQQMSYASKVILETVRLASPSPWSGRVALEDMSMQGFNIKKDWAVAIDLCGLHYDPEVFKDPTKFNPSRFDEKIPPYSFKGFGGGARSCIGSNLAKLEISIFLYHLCTKYSWKSVSKDNALRPTFIRMFKNGYPIKVEPK